MSTQECDAYLDKIMGESNSILSGASDAQLRVTLFDVLEEFFDLSNSWQETIEFIVIKDLQDYKLEPNEGRIVRLLETYDQNRVPQPATMQNFGEVHFLFPYTNTQPMWSVVIKNITDPLDCHPPHVPDWVLPNYSRTITAGILGYMMIQPGTSYFQPTLGNFNLRRYRDGVMQARVATIKANKVGAQAWTYPQQFRTSTQRGGVSTFNVHPTPRTQ
jgi:hypothetical protein